MELVLIDEKLFLEAGRIKGKYPMVLADCFIVTLAKQLKAFVLTEDLEFKKTSKIVKIIWLKK